LNDASVVRSPFDADSTLQQRLGSVCSQQQTMRRTMYPHRTGQPSEAGSPSMRRFEARGVSVRSRFRFR
jgi:hypothetical protein